MATGAGIVFYYDHLKQQKVKAALEGANAKGKGGTAATAGAAAPGTADGSPPQLPALDFPASAASAAALSAAAAF